MNLVERIQSGDKEAIKEVYKENSKEVYDFAKSITGDHESALEATKQTFIKLFSLIQKGQSPTNIRSTALKLAHDEACKIAMPSSDIVTSPYEEDDEELKELDRYVGDHENDGAMGETRVISLPKEAIDELVDDEADYHSIEEVGKTEIHHTQAIPMPSEINEKPSNQRNSYYEDEDYDDDDYDDDDYDDDYYDDREPKKHGAGFAICVIINIILILILIWFVVGLLEHLEIIPQINLGYEWFNAHIADIF